MYTRSPHKHVMPLRPHKVPQKKITCKQLNKAYTQAHKHNRQISPHSTFFVSKLITDCAHMASPEKKINILSDQIKISFILLFILSCFAPLPCPPLSLLLSLSSIDISSFFIYVEVLGAPSPSHSTGRSLVRLTP